MTDEIYINYGGEWLDVDASTFGGFDTSTLWDFKDPATRGKARSLDLSVPATVKNTKIFNYYKLLPGDGVRRGINGAVTAGGKVTNGVIFVTKYSGGRYSLMIAYGRSFGGFTGNYAALTDTMTYSETAVPLASGVIPNFGWYEYANFFSPHATTGIIAEMLPAANIGHIIDSLASFDGYAVNYPDPTLGRQYQAHAYGLVLPSFGLQGVNYQVDITGSAYGGYNATVIGGTLADAGLAIDTAYYRRGQIPQDVKVNVFRTMRKLRVRLPANSGLCLVGGDGYIIYNDWAGTQAADVTFRANAKFAIVRADEWHTSGNNNYWNRTQSPRAYEGSVTVSLQISYGSFTYPSQGDTMSLAAALPDRGLEEWLDLYCNLIAGVWTVDDATHTITIKTYKEMINAAYGDTDHHLSLENEEVISIDSVTRYVDGFSQHNYSKTTDGRYIRDLICYNDYLSETNDLSEINAEAGEQVGSIDPNVTRTYVDDVREDDNGAMVYNGKMTVFFENTATIEGARHIMDTLSMGVGEDVQQLVSNGSSVTVKVRMPYFRYSNINHLTCASLHGRNFVVQKAKWDKGIAQLDILDVGEVLPQMQYNWLNFEMPNGGDITLTRVGNPTAVVLEYSTDGGATWQEWQEVGGVRTLTLPAGGRVWLRNRSGVSTGFSSNNTNHYKFGFSGTSKAYGDTRSLLCSMPFAGMISNGCFFHLFYGCSSLVMAPELPATALATFCYSSMFSGCYNLVTAPELPATTLADGCYSGMFYDCRSLVTAPELPATTLATSCYSSMFRRCQSLVTAPELPATTLADGCYGFMFAECQSLVTAPELPATTLVNICYMYMFYGCTSLDEVIMLATDISASSCLEDWLYNVAASGTLHLDSSLTGIPSNSTSGIPTGWNRVDVDPWINFEMPNGGDITLTRNGNPNTVTLEYSLDGGETWNEWQEVGGVRTLTLSAGGRVWLRNQSDTSTRFSTSSSDYYRFAFTENVESYGDTRSLLCKTASDAVMTEAAFYRLFNLCSTLLAAPRLDSLDIGPSCYIFMFAGCVSLEIAPELPAVVTASNCYRSMFQDCSRLVSAPILPSLSIAEGAYRRMFYNCASLTSLILYATAANASNCTYQWLNGVAASGDLYCPSGLVFTSVDGGVPVGWTRHNV